MLENVDQGFRARRVSIVAALVSCILGCVLAATIASGCATGGTAFGDDPDEGTAGGDTNSTASAQGGSGGGTTSATTSSSWPCGIDCATIQTDDCHQSVCNLDSKQCEVKSADDGTSCEDGLFCTINDTCASGTCTAGDQNDCGMSPPQCSSIICTEASQSCAPQAAQNGASCQDPNNLCLKGTTCSNGLCTGGSLEDCFFFPAPDECHVGVCNPANGICEPQIGNEGGSCTDLNDLCTVSKTCTNGVCQGGSPKDCSQLTQGCNLGVCDVMTGQCVQQAVNEGDPCDDLDACTLGEKCTGGLCLGGTAITQCINQDGCCPAGCTEGNDDDCSCSVNLALTATPTSSGGGSNGTGYGPINWNDGLKEADCKQSGCSKCYGWISNSTSPGTAWAEYAWSGAQQIGSMYVDTNACSGGCSSGRSTVSGQVQYWDGGQWVTAQTFSNAVGDLQFTFSPKLNTTKVRLYAVAAGACSQASNSLFYEWYVWPGSSCQP